MVVLGHGARAINRPYPNGFEHLRTTLKLIAGRPRPSTTMSNLDVAKIILEQLGGGRFIAMTGARNFVGDATSLTFRLPKAKDGINAVKITLDPSDTYTVRFFRVGDRRTNYAITDKSVHEDIYADSLQELFTRKTGLYTHL
jgi:hypothetical protein